MVNQINRKVYRDLMRIKLQVFTIALVIASGVSALIAFLSTQDSLVLARSTFYHESRFADVFAELKRAPLSLERVIEGIPGIVSLETRIVKDFLLHLPDRTDSAVGRFISLPDVGEPRLNRLYLRQGRMPDPYHVEEALISEGFAAANGIKPGDRIAAIINGKYKMFSIVGTALSPEYVYAIRGETPLPDDRHFGIFWVPRKGLEAALDMDGSFNSLSLILGPGSSAREVLSQIDRQLLRYGGLGAYLRRDQVSARYVNDEINQQTVMAVAVPLIFLAVAAFLLNIVLSRLILLQRAQIATLKAMGYPNFTISVHYLKMVLIVVTLGLLLGIGLGVYIGRQLTILYTDFYHFPLLTFTVRPLRILTAVAVTFGAGFLGVASSLRQVFRMQPAEAMRPPAPPSFQESVFERMGITRFLSMRGKMVYRNLTLRPWRTLMGLTGVAFAVMVTMLGLFWWDTVEYVIYSQFFITQREDVEVLFNDQVSSRALEELKSYPGVLRVEGYRNVPIRLRLEQRDVTTGLLGYPPDGQLRLLSNKRLHVLQLPAEGLMLSQLLAKRLQAKAGDLVEVEVLDGKRPQWRLRVANIVDQWVGFAAYIDLDHLKKLLNEDSINMAALLIDSRQQILLEQKLKGVPKVAAVNFKRHTLRMFQATMGKFILAFAGVLTAFALVIAVGVVYNHARIVLSERTWELMSLRVLGFTRQEVFRILGAELLWQMFLALPLGWVLGYCFSALLVKLMHSEAFEIPLIVAPKTFAYASLVVLLSGLISALIIRRRLDRTHLVEALKIRE